jgi:hypothetical protein
MHGFAYNVVTLIKITGHDKTLKISRTDGNRKIVIHEYEELISKAIPITGLGGL